MGPAREDYCRAPDCDEFIFYGSDEARFEYSKIVAEVFVDRNILVIDGDDEIFWRGRNLASQKIGWKETRQFGWRRSSFIVAHQYF